MKYLPALALLCALSGCHLMSEVPAIKTAEITPKVLHPGDTAILRVEMRDRYDIVERLEGRITEEPNRSLRLRDDGEGPDEDAGDDNYALQVDVPKEAPTGTFTLQVSAFRHDGEPIFTHDRKEKRKPLQITMPVTIVPPVGAAAAPAADAPAPAPAPAPAAPKQEAEEKHATPPPAEPQTSTK